MYQIIDKIEFCKGWFPFRGNCGNRGHDVMGSWQVETWKNETVSIDLEIVEITNYQKCLLPKLPVKNDYQVIK